MNGQFEFSSVGEMETMASCEHFMATDVEWDPTGAAAPPRGDEGVHQMENGFHVWTFNGKLLYKHARERFYQFLWRPALARLLSKEKEDPIVKNLVALQALRRAGREHPRAAGSTSRRSGWRSTSNRWPSRPRRRRSRPRSIRPRWRSPPQPRWKNSGVESPGGRGRRGGTGGGGGDHLCPGRSPTPRDEIRRAARIAPPPGAVAHPTRRSNEKTREASTDGRVVILRNTVRSSR